MRILVAVLLLLLPGLAQAAERLTVLELFTSEGCSSCPPAEALVAQLAQRDPALLVLGFHVTYWDRTGWRDPFSMPSATTRQRAYAARLGLDSVYTPQLVIDGRVDAVGSDAVAVAAAIAATRADPAPPLPLALSRDPAGLRIGLPGGTGRAAILVIGYDDSHTTPVRGGENGGRTLVETNVVRAVGTAGDWTGSPATVIAARPAGDHVAVLLQAADGRILGAARL